MPTESNLHTSTQPLETKETHSLIGSDKVEGTAVYRSNGAKIGQIQRVMIGKQSGKVGYAVMSFGGFLGIGEEYYPLPWSLLTYNPRLEGYEVNISDAQKRAEVQHPRKLGLGHPKSDNRRILQDPAQLADVGPASRLEAVGRPDGFKAHSRPPPSQEPVQ